MCNMLHELEETTNRLCLTLDNNLKKEMKDLEDLSTFIKDLYLRKHHNDELMDLIGGKHV